MPIPQPITYSPPPYSTASPIYEAIAHLILPPRKVTLSQWADEEAYIPPESNPVESGKWHTGRAEYLRGIMDAFTDRSVYKIPIMKSSRSGVTAALVINGIGYHIDVDPCPIMYTVPSKGMAISFAKKQLQPTIRDTPKISGRVLAPRMKGSGNTTLFKAFPGGSLQLVWATSPLSFRQETVRVFMADDVDGFPQDVGGEGDPLSLGERRTKTVWNRKIVAISSPTLTGVSRIETAYINSDQRHYYVPCPHCKHEQVLVFGRESVFAKPTNSGLIGGLVHGYTDPATGQTHIGLKFDSDNCTWAVYICENCGTPLDEAAKVEYMVPNGKWRACNPDTSVAGVAGFHINELYSSFNTSFLSVATEFLQAKKKAGGLQVFINNNLGETYDHDSFTISDHALMERREQYETIPEQCAILTMGVDVQADRLEYIIRAWGRDGENWLIDYAVLYGSPRDPQTWNAFDELHKQMQYKHATGIYIRPVITFIDSGDFTHEVYAFTARRQARQIYATKGMSGERRHLIEQSKHRDRTTRALLVLLAVDQAKNHLYDSLKVREAGPNCCHFNGKANPEFFQQLTAEKRVVKYNRKGIPSYQWMKKRDRNEVLDLYVMSYCAKEYIRLHVPRLEREIRKKIDEHKKTGDRPPAPNSMNSIDSTNSTDFTPPKRKSRIIKKSNHWKSSF